MKQDAGSRSIGDLLLDRLAGMGITHVFGVPGDYNLGFLDLIEAREDLEWVGNVNELNAAYAADGYARIRGYAALVTTYGVGELSALNGVAGSFAESVPVLQITGMPATQAQADGLPVHHGLVDGDAGHFRRIYDEVTGASATLTADHAADEIDRVITAVVEQKRPGYLGLPADLVSAPARPGTTTVAPATEPELSSFAVRAKEMLSDATDVVVLVDHLADRFGALDRVRALIGEGKLSSAVVAGGKGLIDEDTPGFLGLYIGALSDPDVRDAVETADVVVGVGLKLVDLSSGGFTARLDPRRLIDVQPGHVVAGGRRFDTAPMAAVLDVVRSAAAERGPASPPPVRKPPAAGEFTPGAELTQDVFWVLVERFLKAGDLVAADQGTSYYGMLGTRLPPGVTLIGQPIWASIGYTLPAMLGAQLAAERHRRALLFIGDGAAGLTVQELGTIVRQGLAPIVFLLDNDGYTCERPIGGWSAGYNDVAKWNWTALPAAFGAHDPLVRSAGAVGELLDVLREAESSPGRLTFVEVRLGRHDLPELLAEIGKTLVHRND
ncbi:thiamine pyrophosphate-binding protein [Amycolatopsis sp. NPDC005232]|uniref:alpha-keto acid decarboxylase family protein n=1 Tax=Amycolatopsis sp. NPDC005232 TaxID=3157027 RepID=UPI0033B72E6F